VEGGRSTEPVLLSFSVFTVHSAADACAILRRSFLQPELPAGSRTRRENSILGLFYQLFQLRLGSFVKYKARHIRFEVTTV
jgi:hypothetical protein